MPACPDQVQASGTTYAQASAYLTAMKATGELAWLNEASSGPLQQAVRHQQAAYARSSGSAPGPLTCGPVPPPEGTVILTSVPVLGTQLPPTPPPG